MAAHPNYLHGQLSLNLKSGIEQKPIMDSVFVVVVDGTEFAKVQKNDWEKLHEYLIR